MSNISVTVSIVNSAFIIIIINYTMHACNTMHMHHASKLETTADFMIHAIAVFYRLIHLSTVYYALYR